MLKKLLLVYLNIYKHFSTTLYSSVISLILNKCGNNFKIQTNSKIIKHSKLTIGDNVSINHCSYINASGEVIIGNNVLIGPFVMIHSGNHNFQSKLKLIRDQGHNLKKTIIGNDVWIASHVCILPGVSIGDGCVIGAGSIVTKSLPPYSIAVGNPAKILSFREEVSS